MPSLTCGGITRLAVERCLLSHLHGSREKCRHSLLPTQSPFRNDQHHLVAYHPCTKSFFFLLNNNGKVWGPQKRYSSISSRTRIVQFPALYCFLWQFQIQMLK